MRNRTPRQVSCWIKTLKASCQCVWIWQRIINFYVWWVSMCLWLERRNLSFWSYYVFIRYEYSVLLGESCSSISWLRTTQSHAANWYVLLSQSWPRHKSKATMILLSVGLKCLHQERQRKSKKCQVTHCSQYCTAIFWFNINACFLQSKDFTIRWTLNQFPCNCLRSFQSRPFHSSVNHFTGSNLWRLKTLSSDSYPRCSTLLKCCSMSMWQYV